MSAVSGKSAISSGFKVNGASSGKLAGANESKANTATAPSEGKLRS